MGLFWCLLKNVSMQFINSMNLLLFQQPRLLNTM
jgi:hypothetical protein